jgi:mono/diheme cytochrome c family protein
MKYFFVALIGLVAVWIVVLGVQGDRHASRPWQWLNEMDQQQKFKPQSESGFYADGRSARMPIPGTIPTSKPVEQDYLLTGTIGNQWGDGIPVPVTMDLLRRGQERYTINCAVCHGTYGNGQGITTKYGLTGVANLLQDNYRKMTDGEIFNTIGNGKGQMMGYGGNLVPADRWAIVTYVRVLQKAQAATLEDVPASDLNKLGAP